MLRLVLFLIAVLAAAAGLQWLADRPGTITIEWQDYVAETSVFRAFVILAVLLALGVIVWSLLRQVWAGPATLGRLMQRRRHKRGLDALSGGMIAIGAGDAQLASRYAGQARKALPNEPLTHLLRAQAAQLTGDKPTSRRIFEAMLASPDTEQLGLRGLFLEAQRENEPEAARQFAERALKLNARLGWPVEALFDLQCKAQDWTGALETLAIGRRSDVIDKATANRRRAVLLTAQAQAIEDSEPERALELAMEAHRLAYDLVPAAAIAGRVLASQGSTPRAARVLLKTWRLAPHPELATIYAYARPGDSPRDRLQRVRHLGRLTPNESEASIALALAAIEAREWDEARRALAPLLEDRLTQRVCTLMARIEGGQLGNTGGVREWLARAVNAPRDPSWTADGVIADRWAPTSPVTGKLDAFRWRVPVEALDPPAGAVLAAKVEALVRLGESPEGRLEHEDDPVTGPVVVTGAAMADTVPAAEAGEVTQPPRQESGHPPAAGSLEAAKTATSSIDRGTATTVTAAPVTVEKPPAPVPVEAHAPPVDAQPPPVADGAAKAVTGETPAKAEPVAKPAPVVQRPQRKVTEPRIFVPPRAGRSGD